MNKKEINQVQCGDYFMFKGEIVRIRDVFVGNKSENTYSIFVETKNGKGYYVDIEELQPITINDYTLKQAGFDVKDCLNNDYACFYGGVLVEYKDNAVMWISGHCGDISNCKIHDFHVLQNALRLFGEEVELKQ